MFTDQLKYLYRYSRDHYDLFNEKIYKRLPLYINFRELLSNKIK